MVLYLFSWFLGRQWCLLSTNYMHEYVYVGAPHSCFSVAEGTFNPPHRLYWQQSLLQSVSTFFTTPMDNDEFTIGVKKNGGGVDKTVCVSDADDGEDIDAEAKVKVFGGIGERYYERARERYYTGTGRGV